MSYVFFVCVFYNYFGFIVICFFNAAIKLQYSY